MLWPWSARTKTPSWLRNRPIAHRGLHDEERPENSLAAFEAAAQAGYPIELDVHRTADDQVVVFHDATLDRLTGRSGRVAETDLADLMAMRLLGTDQAVPSLDQALECIAGRVPVLVELKARDPIGHLEQAVDEVLRRHPGDYAVQAFNPYSMQWMCRHAPQWPRGMLSGDFGEMDLPTYQKLALRNLMLAPLVRPCFVGYELWALPSSAASFARRQGLTVVAWTVRDEAGLRRARTLADNVIFERVVP